MVNVDYTAFLNMTAEEIKQDWLDYIRARDPLMKDVGPASWNAMFAEAVASQFWIFIQLLKQKVIDSTILTAEGDALSALVLDRLPDGRYSGDKATGYLKFSRATAAQIDYNIPAGSQAAMKTEDGDLIYFQTTAAATLETGQTQVVVAAEAVEPGEEGNVAAYTIAILISAVVGIESVTNELGFDGGTEQEPDQDLRLRYIYTIWISGRATIPLMKEHIDALDIVREVLVTTLGQGDLLIVVDSDGGVDNPDPDGEIDDAILDDMAAGCTAPGILGASLRSGGHTFELGDTSGGQVWIRTLQYLSLDVQIDFTYTDSDGTPSKSGTITLPAGSPAGYTMQATLNSPTDLASFITASTYSGALSFDMFMGLGTYPRLFVEPELQTANVMGTVVITATPELDLLESINASVQAKLASYKIGEKLQFADIYRHVFIDYATGHVFEGIDDVPTFSIVCKGTTLDAIGEELTLESDERIEPGGIDITNGS